MVPGWKREQTGRDFFGLFLKHMQDMEKNPEWKAEFEARGWRRTGKGRRRSGIVMRLSFSKPHTSPHVNPEGCAYPLQHICADGLVPGHLPIGGFTDPRQVNDVAGTVSTPFHEEPESGTGDHACHLPLHVFYPALDKSVNSQSKSHYGTYFGNLLISVYPLNQGNEVLTYIVRMC